MELAARRDRKCPRGVDRISRVVVNLFRESARRNRWRRSRVCKVEIYFIISRVINEVLAIDPWLMQDPFAVDVWDHKWIPVGEVHLPCGVSENTRAGDAGILLFGKRQVENIFNIDLHNGVGLQGGGQCNLEPLPVERKGRDRRTVNGETGQVERALPQIWNHRQHQPVQWIG